MTIEELEAQQSIEAKKVADRAQLITDLKQQTNFEQAVNALFTIENTVAVSTNVRTINIAINPPTGEAMKGYIIASDGIKRDFTASQDAVNIPDAVYKSLKAMNEVFKASLTDRLNNL